MSIKMTEYAEYSAPLPEEALKEVVNQLNIPDINSRLQRSSRLKVMILGGKDSCGAVRRIALVVDQEEQAYPTKCVYTLNVMKSPNGLVSRFSYFEPAVGAAINPRVVKEHAINKLWDEICEKYF